MLTAETSHPKGHRLNPLTDAEVEAKFRGLAEPVLGVARCGEVLKQVWAVDSATSLDTLFESLVISS
jgi:2-methylcitrate dehydratase